MPIQTSKNLYRGVNPHLNSMFQSDDTETAPLSFRSFHTPFIGQLMFHLNARLPSKYIAVNEESMQLVRPNDDNSRPQPDISIASHIGTPFGLGEAIAPVPTWEEELFATLDPLDTLNAVEIRLSATRPALRKLVACIELLSPANKAGKSYYEIYRTRRAEYISSRIPLIEVDFLHETAPVVIKHPIYPHQIGSHPYYIALNDARPQVEKARVYGFDVNQSAPLIYIPLLGSDYVVVDFNEVYQTVFQGGRFGDYVDYAQLPERFDTYSADDQQRIKTRMAEITQEYGEQQS